MFQEISLLNNSIAGGINVWYNQTRSHPSSGRVHNISSDVFPLRCVVADFFLCVALSLTLKNVAKPATAQVSSSTNVANPKSCLTHNRKFKQCERRVKGGGIDKLAVRVRVRFRQNTHDNNISYDAKKRTNQRGSN
jgi:hypothetical protein